MYSLAIVFLIMFFTCIYCLNNMKTHSLINSNTKRATTTKTTTLITSNESESGINFNI